MSESPEDCYDLPSDDGCDYCHGEGYIHDCGEDTCCCANPDEDDVYPCPQCCGGVSQQRRKAGE